jgi:hypothetical protein
MKIPYVSHIEKNDSKYKEMYTSWNNLGLQSRPLPDDYLFEQK